LKSLIFPSGYFITKIFHPNVSKNGEICVNTLKKDWNAKKWSIDHILQVPLQKFKFKFLSGYKMPPYRPVPGKCSEWWSRQAFHAWLCRIQTIRQAVHRGACHEKSIKEEAIIREETNGKVKVVVCEGKWNELWSEHEQADDHDDREHLQEEHRYDADYFK